MKYRQAMVSVVIPVYNAEIYLRECLDSLTMQSYQDIEIMVIDDGSVDGSLKVAKEYAASDARITVITQKNAGVSSARNKGLEEARGEYVLFVDADDYLIRTDAIEMLVGGAISSGTDLTVFEIFYENKSRNVRQSRSVCESERDKYMADLIASEDLNSPCNKLYKKSIIDNHDIRFDKNIRIGEDLLFNIQYVKCCEDIRHLGEQLYFYRTSNQASATKKYMPEKYEQLMLVNDGLIGWVSTVGSKKMQDATLYIRMKNILSCIRDLGSVASKLSYKDRINRAVLYKRNNSTIIVRRLGMRKLSISLIYSACSARTLLRLAGML